MTEAYKIVKTEEAKELHGVITLLEHRKTKARVITIKNHDPNKVFLIAFRTTSDDSTGVAHIMEHSVLCGSEKYPVKDPFVELIKGSLNTFLNAMTAPDMTIYPVASTNDKDFMNLMDVYLDSVFYPNIYREPKILMQEGWHYEMENFGTADETLSYNGVVYNEMKGAMSNPDEILERCILEGLFPDTIYRHEYGGDPEVIPTLTYESFKDFHRRYYHPSNSYIYLYGDMDMEEKLAWIDENYLKNYEQIEVDSAVTPQDPLKEPNQIIMPYAIGENESEKGKTYLSADWCIQEEPDLVTDLAFRVLEFILLNSPGAILKEALIDAGIGNDISGGYGSQILQPYFSVVAKNTDIEKKEEFICCIRDTLSELVKKGISKKSLKAAINFIEFKLREEDYGSFPKGLAWGFNILSPWIHGRDPFECVYYESALEELKSKLDTDYFEELLRKNILENNFSAIVAIVPKKGLSQEKDEEQKAKLEAYRKSLSKEERAEIFKETQELKKFQTAPNEPEDLAKLPVLKVSDIEPKARKVNYHDENGVIFSEADCNGIAYIRVLFDTEGATEDELQFLAFLRDVLGQLSTVNYSYSDLFDEVLLNTGGISYHLDTYVSRKNPGDKPVMKGYFTTDICTLEDHIEEALKLTLEILEGTKFDDAERISRLLSENKSQQRLSLENRMDRVAAIRAASYFNISERYHDLTDGIAYYDFLDAAVKLCNENTHLGRFIKSLEGTRDRFFVGSRLKFAVYGSKEALKKVSASIPDFKARLEEAQKAAIAKVRKEALEFDPEEIKGFSYPEHAVPGNQLKPAGLLNEGFKTTQKVNYTARCGDFTDEGLRYDGALRVLSVMLNFEYMWVKIRVLGGAYGCHLLFSRTGSSFFSSFRDPHIRKTNEVFEGIPGFIENWNEDEKTVQKYIIGAISGLDRPLSDSLKAAEELSNYFYQMRDEELQTERDEVLLCTAARIRELAKYAKAVLDSGAVCTIGNSTAVSTARELYKITRELF